MLEDLDLEDDKVERSELEEGLREILVEGEVVWKGRDVGFGREFGGGGSVGFRGMG